ncbi:hypothetical protein [Actinomadura sp. WMMA1423]|uniref:hypothetical protein n=1 Tax=Actinomadura sp. WMMA1423 TaxID=2591108 RepID=UPI0011465695|nr:hypothetical protein [Actinomadura sp. WMMA1423]
MSEVTELIKSLRDGEISLEELASRFREREWPATPKPETYMEVAAAEEQDPAPDPPGSFSEVYSAYRRRELSPDEFRVLKTAAVEGMNAGGQEANG